MVALRERGAFVTGVDSSVRMLELARERLGDDAALHAADLSRPLPFADGAFDDVIACLVLHYLEDWAAPLAELRRVLVPGGRLVVAVNHPFVRKLADSEADYFATHAWSEKYTLGVQRVVVSEPAPAPGAREVFPEVAGMGSEAFLCFLFFVLEAV